MRSPSPLIRVRGRCTLRPSSSSPRRRRRERLGDLDDDQDRDRDRDRTRRRRLIPRRLRLRLRLWFLLLLLLLLLLLFLLLLLLLLPLPLLLRPRRPRNRPRSSSHDGLRRRRSRPKTVRPARPRGLGVRRDEAPLRPSRLPSRRAVSSSVRVSHSRRMSRRIRPGPLGAPTRRIASLRGVVASASSRVHVGRVVIAAAAVSSAGRAEKRGSGKGVGVGCATGTFSARGSKLGSMGYAAVSCHVKDALVREGDVDDGAVDIAAVHVPEGVFGVVSGVELDEADAGGVGGGRGATLAGRGARGSGAMRGSDSTVVREDLLEVTRGDVLREVGDAKDARGRGAIVPRARVEILLVALVVGIHLVVRPRAPSARSRRGFGTRRRRAATEALPTHPARATLSVPPAQALARRASGKARVAQRGSASELY